VELWDGRTYCGRCVEEHAPSLASLAHSPILSENMPYSIRAIASRAFLFAFALTTGFAVAIGLRFVIAGQRQEAVQAFVVFLLLGLPVILIWTCAAALAMPLLRPKVMAWKGQFIVRFGTRLFIAPLRECSWSEGKMARMTVWRHSYLLQGTAIIIRLPTEFAMKRRCAAVGFTPNTFEAWKSFLTIAGVPRTPAKRSAWSRLVRGLGMKRE